MIFSCNQVSNTLGKRFEHGRGKTKQFDFLKEIFLDILKINYYFAGRKIEKNLVAGYTQIKSFV